MQSNPLIWTAWLVATWVVYYILQALYNISPLHPLHKIPGPKLAAATYLSEFYYDIILGGRYTHAIKAMHEKYGTNSLGGEGSGKRTNDML